MHVFSKICLLKNTLYIFNIFKIFKKLNKMRRVFFLNKDFKFEIEVWNIFKIQKFWKWALNSVNEFIYVNLN